MSKILTYNKTLKAVVHQPIVQTISVGYRPAKFKFILVLPVPIISPFSGKLFCFIQKCKHTEIVLPIGLWDCYFYRLILQVNSNVTYHMLVGPRRRSMEWPTSPKVGRADPSHNSLLFPVSPDLHIPSLPWLLPSRFQTCHNTTLLGFVSPYHTGHCNPSKVRHDTFMEKKKRVHTSSLLENRKTGSVSGCFIRYKLW